MSTVTFSNGKSAQFEGTPTPQDIDYVAKQMGISADGGSTSQSASGSTSLFDKTVPEFAPSTGNESPVAAGAKTLANLIPSTINAGIGIAEMPFKGIYGLKDIPGAVGGLVKDAGGIVPAAEHFAGGVYKTLMPNAGQNLVNAFLNKTGISNILPNGVKDYIAPNTTDQSITNAQQSVTNDPVGQILPFFMLGREAAYKVSPEAGAAFDSAVSKVATPATATGDFLGGILKKTAGAPADVAGAAGKFVASQATGLPYKAVGELIDHPADYSAENRANINRASVTADIKTALDQKIADLSDTGKEYQGIRGMKTIDDSVSPETTKTIREGGQTLQYNLVDAPDEKLSVPELRAKVKLLEADQTTPGDVLHNTHAALAEKELTQTVDHPVNVQPRYIDRLIKENTGVDINKDGQLTTSGSARIRDPKDVRALQNLYNTWKPVFEKGKMTTDEFMNFRSDLGKMAHYEREITSSADLENMADIMRGKFNSAYRKQIPGLEDLDRKYGPMREEIKTLKKGILNKDGTLSDSANKLISNATNKGNDMRLARLEQIKPGITRQIQIMRTIEDIESARENKPGTYARTALGPGGILAGLTTANLPLVVAAIGETILSSPSVAVPLLRAYGFSKEVTGGVITYLKNAAGKVNELPNTGVNPLIPQKIKSALGTDVSKLPMGLSIEDVSKKLQPFAAEASKYDSVEQMLPKNVASSDIKSAQVFGSSVKGGKYHDVDVALFIDENHPTIKKIGSEYNRKVGNIEYHVFPDNDEGHMTFDAMLDMKTDTGKGIAVPISNMQKFFDKVTGGGPEQTLTAEASKYKSYDEFKKALNVQYEDSGWKGPKAANADELKKTFKGFSFHGTNAVDQIKEQGFKKGQYFNSGAYFSDTPDVALDYMKQNRSTGKTSDVFAVKLDNLKLKQGEGEIIRSISKNNTGMEEYVDKLKKQGFDGIKDAYGQTLVWNTDKIKNMQTLKEIWEKGQKLSKGGGTKEFNLPSRPSRSK